MEIVFLGIPDDADCTAIDNRTAKLIASIKELKIGIADVKCYFPKDRIPCHDHSPISVTISKIRRPVAQGINLFTGEVKRRLLEGISSILQQQFPNSPMEIELRPLVEPNSTDLMTWD